MTLVIILVVVALAVVTSATLAIGSRQPPPRPGAPARWPGRRPAPRRRPRRSRRPGHRPPLPRPRRRRRRLRRRRRRRPRPRPQPRRRSRRPPPRLRSRRGSGAPVACWPATSSGIRGRKGIDETTFERARGGADPRRCGGHDDDIGSSTICRPKFDERHLSATDPSALLQALQADLTAMFEGDDESLAFGEGEGPTVWLFVGVNGVGKTTTIGKLALREMQGGAGGRARGRGHVPGSGRRAARDMGGACRREDRAGFRRRRPFVGHLRRRPTRSAPEEPDSSWPTPPAGSTRR